MKRPVANNAAIDCIKFNCRIQSTYQPTNWLVEAVAWRPSPTVPDSE